MFKKFPLKKLPLPRLPGWKSTLLALLLIWASGFTTLVSAIDAVIYDFYSTYAPPASSHASKILLIETDFDRQSSASAEFEALALKSLENGAEEIIFLFTPKFSEAFSHWAASTGKVLTGGLAQDDPSSPETYRAPRPVHPSPIPSGLVHINPRTRGVYSSQQTAFTLNGSRYPAIEFLAARAAGHAIGENEVYWINFSGGLSSLPRMSLDEALQGNLIPELIKGRSIIVGLRGGGEQPRLNFPGGKPYEAASPNEFHAFALNTLLNDQAITHPSSGMRLTILAIFAIIVFLVHQPIPLRHTLRITLVVAATYSLLGWVALSYFHAWPPMSELMLMHLATLSLVYRSKGRDESLRLERLLVETSAKLHDRILPASFADIQEHWASAIVMVEQMLSLNRLIFLERIPGDHRLREIKALHCDVNDIDEKRRDYERTPYTTALKQQSALEVRNYLKPVDAENERQFLVPLVFGGDVLGFWAFGIEDARLTDAPDFLKRTEQLAEQLSLLLYQRKIRRDQEEGENRQWERYFADRQSATIGDLQNAITLQEKRLESVEHVFNHLATAAILYDFFGRVVLVNEQMQSMLRLAGINPYRMTAVDLITMLTGKHRETIREYVQFTVFEERHMSLHASVGANQPVQCLLSLRAVGVKERLPENHADSSPFHSDGLLVELVDISEINRIQNIRLQVVERLKYLVKNEITALSMASEMLETPDLPKDRRATVLETIHSKVVSATQAMDKTMAFLSEDHFSHALECYPVDALGTLQKTIENCRNIAMSRRIFVNASLPGRASFAMATQQDIADVFQSILDYLLDDTVEDGQISITMHEQAHRIEITLENTGMGMPQASMDAFMYGQEEVSSDAFRRLRNAVANVRQWEGSLKCASQMGKGVCFTLSLEAFL